MAFIRPTDEVSKAHKRWKNRHKRGRKGVNLTPVEPGKEHLAALTDRERKFVEIAADETVKTGTFHRGNTSVLAGYSEKAKGSTGSILMTRELVREAFMIELKRRGIDERTKARVLGEAMNAEKVVRDNMGGEVDREIDHKVRLEAVRELNKIDGSYAPQSVQVDKRVASINVHTELSEKELGKAIEELTQEINNLKGKD